MKRNKKGFTLVEIIVVLVILAILAAIAVPAVLGYIDDAKEARELAKLRESLIAAQVTFVKSAASGESGHSANDIKKECVDRFLTDNQAKDLLKGLETTPYILMYGTGDPDVYEATSSEASKVYCIIYQKDSKSKPWFYDGKKWSHRYLWKTNGNSYDISRAMYVKQDTWGNYHNYMRDVRDSNGQDTAVSIYYAYINGSRVYTKPDGKFWQPLKDASE